MPINILVGVERLVAKLESPDLITALGNDLSRRLSEAAPVASGATRRALEQVGQPERTGTGWSIGVGDSKALGQPNEPMPAGVLRAFYSYLESRGVKPRYTNWFGLSYQRKEEYESFRRSNGIQAQYAWIVNSALLLLHCTAYVHAHSTIHYTHSIALHTHTRTATHTTHALLQPIAT